MWVGSEISFPALSFYWNQLLNQNILISDSSFKAISLKSTKYCISFRGSKIWNIFLTKEEKEWQSLSIFKNVVHSKLLQGEYEL